MSTTWIRGIGHRLPQCVAVACGLLAPWIGTDAGETNAQELSPLRFSAGVLGGFSPRSGDRRLRELAADATMSLGRRHSLGRQWHVTPQLEMSLGGIECGPDNAFMAAVGPALVFGRGSFPITIHTGLRPTYLSEQTLGWKEMGSDFQFSSHLGLEWRFLRRWHVGYRVQHMSNAGFGDPNPGMNLHMFDVGLHF